MRVRGSRSQRTSSRPRHQPSLGHLCRWLYDRLSAPRRGIPFHHQGSRGRFTSACPKSRSRYSRPRLAFPSCPLNVEPECVRRGRLFIVFELRRRPGHASDDHGLSEMHGDRPPVVIPDGKLIGTRSRMRHTRHSSQPSSHIQRSRLPQTSQGSSCRTSAGGAFRSRRNVSLDACNCARSSAGRTPGGLTRIFPSSPAAKVKPNTVHWVKISLTLMLRCPPTLAAWSGFWSGFSEGLTVKVSQILTFLAAQPAEPLVR